MGVVLATTACGTRLPKAEIVSAYRGADNTTPAAPVPA